MSAEDNHEQEIDASDEDRIASLMTPEEIAAMNGEDSAEDLEAMRELAAEGSEDQGDEGEEESEADSPTDETQEGEAEPEEASEPEAEPESVAKAEEPAESAAPAQRGPYTAQLPDGYEEQVKQIKDRELELRKSLREGEIDAGEYDDAIAELMERRDAMLLARAKAEISREMTAQSAEQQWATAINTAFDTWSKSGGIDYRQDAAKAQDLDAFIKVLAQNPANEAKSMAWFLEEGNRRVRALHGIVDAAADDDAARKAAEATEKAKRESALKAARDGRKPPEPPKTLAQTPGGGAPGDVGGEFADLLSLEGSAYEEAIEKLSPAQLKRFMRTA